MDDMFSLKEKYGMNSPGIDLNILRWPAFMSPTNLPEGEKRKLHKKLKDWFEVKTSHPLMMDHERSQIERLISYIDVIEQGHVETEEDIEKHHHDFKSFYVQHDKRRGSDFRKAFPDAVEWYDSIEVDTNIPQVKVNDGRITHFEAGEYLPDMEKRLTAVSSAPLPPAIKKRNEEQAKKNN